MQPFGRNGHGPKIGGAVPLWGGGAGSPSNTYVARAEAYLHAKFHLDLSNRMATIDQPYRQTGQDRQTDRQRQRSDSIVRPGTDSFLQTVAQKLYN